jgi:transposase-like protein
MRESSAGPSAAGERVNSLSKEFVVSEGTLHLWKRQALIDVGRVEGIKSFEADELAQAHRTIVELETELEVVKAAVALFNGEEPVSPKKAVPDRPRPEQSGLQRARRVSE